MVKEDIEISYLIYLITEGNIFEQTWIARLIVAGNTWRAVGSIASESWWAHATLYAIFQVCTLHAWETWSRMTAARDSS